MEARAPLLAIHLSMFLRIPSFSTDLLIRFSLFCKISPLVLSNLLSWNILLWCTRTLSTSALPPSLPLVLMHLFRTRKTWIRAGGWKYWSLSCSISSVTSPSGWSLTLSIAPFSSSNCISAEICCPKRADKAEFGDLRCWFWFRVVTILKLSCFLAVQ